LLALSEGMSFSVYQFRKPLIAWFLFRLQSLNDIASQRLNSLRKVDADVADVVEWLSKNQAMFRQEIIMPAWISVFVKDPKYQGMVESEFFVILDLGRHSN
jgi:hypothetical protein